MPEDRHQFDAQLERYLDDALPAEQRTEFEARLERDEEARAALALQRRLDASLRRKLAPPSVAQLEPILDGARSAAAHTNGHAGHHHGVADLATALELTPATGAGESAPLRRHESRWSWPRRLAVAAVLALVFVLGWFALVESQPAGRYAVGEPRSMVDVYRSRAEIGFAPDWRCESEQIFIETFQETLGQPLRLAEEDMPADISMLGLAYDNVLTPRTIIMTGLVEGEGVLVFIDRNGPTRPATVSGESGLQVFQREVGNLVLYELTPLDSSRMLKYFEVPDMR